MILDVLSDWLLFLAFMAMPVGGFIGLFWEGRSNGER